MTWCARWAPRSRFLEDVSGRFSVRAGPSNFDRPEDARRYNRLRDQADSLLQSPVEMDPRPIFRPPRRFVTRLLITLPGGMARGASETLTWSRS
jgi:hypothetical protein